MTMKLDKLPKEDQELVKELGMTSHQYEWHKKYNLERKSYWDCHGKAVPTHPTMQRVAETEGITFGKYEVVECDVHRGIVVCQVTGTWGDRQCSALGEAHPRNNKNAYPTAMAQKRAFDRVVTELTNSGMYTESDMMGDDFAPPSGFKEAEQEEQRKKTKEQAIAEAMAENKELESD